MHINQLAKQLQPIDHYMPPAPKGFRHAAVMVLLINDTEQTTELGPAALGNHKVVLTERSKHLKHHPSQISFPGGRFDQEDQNLLETATREAEEEVGLDREGIRLLGQLTTQPTPTRFIIKPYVATISTDWVPRITSKEEVTKIYLPSINELLDPANQSTDGNLTYKGMKVPNRKFAVTDPPVWGVTARILWELLEKLPNQYF